VIVWDLRTGQPHATLAGHTQPVTAVACTSLEDGILYRSNTRLSG
jgi:hypothetical protein